MGRPKATDTPSVGFSCTCGKVRGRMAPVSARSGAHIVCHCKDCSAAERFLGQPDPGSDGVDLFLTTPDTVKFDSGIELLGAIRLSPKGPLRWYATCCNATLFACSGNPGIPFLSAQVKRLDSPAAVGPVITQAFVPQPGGTPKHSGAGRMMMKLVPAMGAARLSGRWRQNPFFDMATRAPIAEPKLLSKEERRAASPDQRSTSG
jgi:hypothetical protein